MESIVKLERAAQMLAEAKSMQDILKVNDIAEAARTYARAAKLGIDAQNAAAEIAILAKRRAGEYLARLERSAGGRPENSSNVGRVSEYSETLEQANVTRQDANRWMQIASVPEDKFTGYIEEVKGAGKELTAAAVVKFARNLEVAEKINSIASQETGGVDGLYDVIVIDPPWQMEKIERDVAPNQVGFDYPTMNIDDIKSIELPASENCHLFLWTTHKYLPYAFEILKEWQANYICTFTWHKNGGFQPFGLPQYNCEFALYARIGTPRFIDFKDFMVCFNAKRGAHSEKPEEFYSTLRRVTSGRRLDMFNRRKIEGFDGWGNEA